MIRPKFVLDRTPEIEVAVVEVVEVAVEVAAEVAARAC